MAAGLAMAFISIRTSRLPPGRARDIVLQAMDLNRLQSEVMDCSSPLRGMRLLLLEKAYLPRWELLPQ